MTHHLITFIIESGQQMRKVDWLVKTQQRQQALTGLQSLCKQRIEENTGNFSEDSFCRLFSQQVSHPHLTFSVAKKCFNG